ncbi:vesicle transport protein [Gongronella butleri]|nr:vesicle transport protein [Gongronella butleri]
MVPTTDETNMLRLLQHCEQKCQEDDVSSWSFSQKHKYASYITYLEFLAQRVRQRDSRSSTDYDARIQYVKQMIRDARPPSEAKNEENDQIEENQTIQTPTDEQRQQPPHAVGVLVAEQGRKAYLAQLQHLEQPEPEWLTKMKRGADHDADAGRTHANDDESDHAAQDKRGDDGSGEGGKDMDGWDDLDEDVLDDTPRDATLAQPPTESEPALRQRARTTAKTREEETVNIEHVLQHHRQLHDEMTNDLSKMAKQLKMNTQQFGDTLNKDNKVLQEANTLVEANLTRMKMERQRLDAHQSKSWGTTCMNLGVVLFVCITFVFVFFAIKILPKA